MEILIIAGLILLNGILSMSEIAVISARKSRLEIDAKNGSNTAKTALELIKQPDKFFSTVQIGITLIGILTGLYSGEVFAKDFAAIIAKVPFLSAYSLVLSETIIVLTVTYFTLIFGELVPKRLGLWRAENISKTMAKPMFFLSRIVSPFVWLLAKSTSAVLKIFGVKIDDDSKVTEEEIKAVVKEGYHDGEVQEVEHEIVERVFNLGDRDVSSIMTHRSELIWLDITHTNDQIRDKVKANIFDIYPVVSEKLENVVGVVHLKDLFGKIDSSDFSLTKLVKPAQFLPANKSVYSALEQIKRTHEKYGIVIDEFGDVLGIVTLTDIMEALIGEIVDIGEEQDIIEREDGSWLVDGQCSFYNFLEYFDIEFLYPNNDYNTLSGLILEKLEHVPHAGEKLLWHNFEFKVANMDGVRIDNILVTRIL